MKTCPICKKDNATFLCANCGFDSSCDYEKYPTLEKIPAENDSIAARQSVLSERETNILCCPKCGCTRLTLDHHLQCSCTQCQHRFTLYPTGLSIMEQFKQAALKLLKKCTKPYSPSRHRESAEKPLFILGFGVMFVWLYFFLTAISTHTLFTVWGLIPMLLLCLTARIQFRLWKYGFANLPGKNNSKAFSKAIYQFVNILSIIGCLFGSLLCVLSVIDHGMGISDMICGLVITAVNLYYLLWSNSRYEELAR